MNKKLLDIYSDYLISQNQYATATGLSRLLDGDISHDQITRFLNREELTSKDLWQYVKPEIRKHEHETTGVFIVDDTIEEKPHTDENNTMCWHFSHAKGKCVKGVNILSGLIRYNDFALPVAFESIVKIFIFAIRRQERSIGEQRLPKMSYLELCYYKLFLIN